MPSSNIFPLSCIRAALTLRCVSVPQIARKHGASYHSCYAVLAGTRPGRNPQVRSAIREMFVIARRVLGPTHRAIRVLKNSLHASASLARAMNERSDMVSFPTLKRSRTVRAGHRCSIKHTVRTSSATRLSRPRVTARTTRAPRRQRT